MKINYYIYLLTLTVTSLLTGCGYDNFEPPQSRLTGTVVYNGNPIQLRNNTVELELWQHGYAFFTKIPVYVAQDGTFSAQLFDGDYKLVLRANNGPWLNNTDSIDVQLRGAAEVDVPVMPYFTISTEGLVKNGNNIEGNVSIARANGTNTLENVTVFVSSTNIVDATNNRQTTVKAGGTVDINAPVPVSVALNSAMSARSHVFVRVGVKVTGVVEMIYTPVQRIDF
jgi:hypothetical protein